MSKAIIPIISTKLKQPRLNNELLTRPHLISNLAKNQHKALTLIMGPAGFGKTTLLNQWCVVLSSTADATGWLTLDQYDNELDSFLSYLCEVFKVMEPSFSISLKPYSNKKDEAFPRLVVTELINFIVAQPKRYFLFLDDYHEITNPAINDVVQFLLNNLPGNLHLYIGCRGVPSLCLSQLKIAGELHLIGHQLMKFSKKEIRQVVGKNNNIAISEQQLSDIIDGTEGWPAAVQLAAISLQELTDGSEIIGNISKSEYSASDFLAQEIFSRLCEQKLDSMLALSLLDRFCSSLALAMDENIHFQALIDNPLASGLIQRFDGPGSWFRFHPLIRCYLLKGIEAKGHEHCLLLRRKAAHWFEENGYIVEAVNHFLAADGQSETFKLLERHATKMMEQGHTSLLIQLVEQLPQKHVFGCRNIIMPLIWAKLLEHELPDIQALIKQMEALLVDVDKAKRARLQGEISVMRAAAFAVNEKFSLCEQELKPWLNKLSPDQHFAKVVAANVMSISYLNNYQFEEIYQIQQQAVVDRNQLNSYGAHVYSYLFICMAKFQQGRLVEAKESSLMIEQLPKTSPHTDTTVKVLGKILHALCSYQLGDLGDAKRLLSEQTFSMRHYAFVDLLIKLVVVKGRLHQHEGELQQALQFYLQLEDDAKQRNSLRLQACILHERVRLHLKCNDQKTAIHLLEQWQQKHGESSTDSTGLNKQAWEWAELARLRVAILTKQDQPIVQRETCQSLVFLTKRFATQGRMHMQLSTQLLLAICYQQQKQVEQAHTVLMAAFTLDSRHEWWQTFLDESEHLLPILQQFIRRESSEILREHCQALLKLMVSDSVKKTSIMTKTSINELIEPLTHKETRVLSFVAQGLSNKEVAGQLAISVETVKSHLKSVYLKMKVNRRTQAVSLARELELLD